jgi:opacity protein-like surface antigen
MGSGCGKVRGEKALAQGRKFYVTAAVAGIVVCLAIPAEAQLFGSAAGPAGFYIGAEGGWTDLLAATNTGDCAGGCRPPFPGAQAVSLERFSAGFNFGGRAGYQWGAWRFEGEVNYRRNDSHGLDMVFPTQRTGRSDGADRRSISEMANLIYDIDLGWPVTPHIGGGVGAAQVTRNLSNRFGGTHDTVTVLAYQGLAGIRYRVTPAVALDIDYRYFATDDTKFTSTNPSTIKSDYGSHNVVVSLTWLFGSPLP